MSARTAVALVFFLNGFATTNWLPRIPEVKDRLGLDPAGLGTALVGLGLGGLLGSLLAGRLVAAVGSRWASLAGACALALVLPTPALAPSWGWLGAALVLVGTSDAVTDVAMNAHAVRVQRLHPRPILNRFHALWSLGAASGAAAGSWLAAVGIPLLAHLLAVAAALAVLTLAATTRFLPGKAALPLPGRRPRLTQLGPLGLLALIAGVVEGAPADWGALYLRDQLGAPAGVAGLGYAAFAAAMLVGRLLGDRLVAAWGRQRAVWRGGVVAAVALAVVAAAPSAWVAVAGFGVAGLGVATLFPALFAAAGDLPGLPEGAGISAVSLLARAGFMLGPLLVGAVAQLSGLGLGLALVAAVTAGGAGMARAVRERLPERS